MVLNKAKQVLYTTGSEITRICPPQTRGRKIDSEFIFLIFIREQHEDSITQIKKKSVVYTLSHNSKMKSETGQDYHLILLYV